MARVSGIPPALVFTVLLSLQQKKDQLDNILLTDSLLQDFKVRVHWVLGSDQVIREGRRCL